MADTDDADEVLLDSSQTAPPTQPTAFTSPQSVPQFRPTKYVKDVKGKAKGKKGDDEKSLQVMGQYLKRRLDSMTPSTTTLPVRQRTEDELFCEMLQCEMAKIQSVPLKRALKRKLLDDVLVMQEQEYQHFQVVLCPAVSVAQATNQHGDIQPASDDAQLLLQLQMQSSASECQ